ncbi:MAG: signal peptidase II [Spirochaetaceae bacterium]|jgi:signal peptidase II|nr:signal peptidase II [Spirochaetaceae bacterium]
MNVWEQRKKHIIITLMVFFVNYSLDRLTKHLAFRYLFDRDVISLLHDCIRLLYIENDGAFLSMGAQWPPVIKYVLLLVVPIGICVGALLYLMIREDKISRIVILACVAGGGIGNLLDRFLNQFRVIDFMNFGIGGFRTGILNMADLSVTFGTVLFIITEYKNDRHTQKGKT